jgi:hypothetical protein
VRAHRDGDDAAAAGVDGVRVGRALGQHPVADLRHRADRDRGRGQRARGDDDLVRRGRQPASPVRRGDLLPQLRQALRVVAGCRQMPRQLLESLTHRAADTRHGRRRRAGEVVQPLGVDPRRVMAAELGLDLRRQRGHAARAALAGQIAAIPQFAVRRSDCGPADSERIGQLALRRHPRARHDPAVRDQQPQALGQTPVRRSGVVGPRAEETGQRAGGKLLPCHAVHYCSSGYRTPGQSAANWIL